MVFEHSDDQPQVYTPSELTREVRLHIEAGFPRILLEGEISNLSRPSSGHLYFTLKDDQAQIRCALFRSAARLLSIHPDNGMKVIARGRITLYEARGDFQMIVDGLRAAGEGLLRQQFEVLKKKLQAEGLFDAVHKQALPPFPRRVGIVTSPSGAAIRDIQQVLQRRWPLAQVRVYPVPVQGEEAPAAIVAALRKANRETGAQAPDVIILGRGGGSLEDLWAFNDEWVARAVHQSGIPVVSAVGHETDFSMTDFVADLRAPTPSAAAELVTPESREIKQRFLHFERQILRRTEQIILHQSQRLDHMTHRLGQRHPKLALENQRKRLDAVGRPLRQAMLGQLSGHLLSTSVLYGRLEQANPARLVGQHRGRLEILGAGLERTMRQHLDRGRTAIGNLARTLQAVSPLQTIGRGYAAIFDADAETIITSINQLETRGRLVAQLVDGRAWCQVESLTDERIEHNLDDPG